MVAFAKQMSYSCAQKDSTTGWSGACTFPGLLCETCALVEKGGTGRIPGAFSNYNLHVMFYPPPPPQCLKFGSVYLPCCLSGHAVCLPILMVGIVFNAAQAEAEEAGPCC